MVVRRKKNQESKQKQFLVSTELKQSGEHALNNKINANNNHHQQNSQMQPYGLLLGSTIEDINKYYKPDLAARLNNSLGVNENFSWINQMYAKQISSSNISVEIKKLRSIVRIKEIKKTLQEQRLQFLQNQMKEIEEILN
jgi:hypothetical protein